MGTSEVFYGDASSRQAELKACHMLVYENEMSSCQDSTDKLFVNSWLGCE